MWLVLACIGALLGQTPAPPAKDPKDSGVFRLPSAFPPEPEPAAKPKEPEAPKHVVLENTGKPIRIPFACHDDDINSLGMTCTIEDPCAVYMELAAVYGLNSRIYLAGNLHNGSSTMYSVLLVSEDNGKTFVEAFDRVRTGGLDYIQFIDNDTGWVGGGLLLALPRDPFLLLTTDGGKSWRQRPVFSESRIGTIDQVAFQSKTAGMLLIDRGQGADGGGRYEKYETMTGGDSWMVREVSARPIPIKAPPPPAADWRLQADPKLKAHSVERKVGERWQRVAAFQIQVGECKPSVNPLEAPPETEQIPEVSSAPVPGEPVVVQRKGPSKPPSLKKPK
jgi:hypothetical protein